MTGSEDYPADFACGGDSPAGDELRPLLELAEKTVRKVQELVAKGENKSSTFEGNDIHTNFDRESHDLYQDALQQTGLPILSEEDIQKPSDSFFLEGLQWVVDPVDGSYNHWRGLPLYCTSIALVQNEKPLLGVIGNLVNGDLYRGGVFHPAQKNGHPVRVSEIRTLSETVLATGFPVGTSLEQWQSGMIRLGLEEIGKVRMLGSASMSLAYLAEGIVDYYWESGIFFWDIAAGIAIVESAGGTYSFEPKDGKRLEVIAGGKVPTSSH